MRNSKETDVKVIFILGIFVLLPACFDYPEVDDELEQESKSDPDKDSDSDGDTDSDMNAESGADADTDTDFACSSKINDYQSCVNCLCAVEMAACKSKQDCTDLLSCLVNCNNSATCMNECENDYTDGIGELYALYNCTDTQCANYICECAYGESSCDAGYLKSCDDGCNWTVNDCEDVCNRSGYDYSTGDCSYSDDFGRDVCWCNNCECKKGDYLCDGNRIKTCDNGCNWATADCETVCVSNGYDHSTGDCSYSDDSRHDVCWCNHCECEKGDQLCDKENLKSCNNGCNWTTRDCDTICVSDGYDYSTGCSYSPDYGVELCWCSYD